MGKSAFGASLYGAARALQDFQRGEREEKAFESDQAIRDERLNQEREAAPLRRRALELGVQNAEQQFDLTSLNIDTARMDAETKAKAQREMNEALKKSKRLELGLGNFHASGDPQAVADAMAETYPEQSGFANGKHNFSAIRNSDGSIILKGPAGEKVLKGGKTQDGRAYTADEELGMLAYKIFNPLEVYKKRLETDFAVEKEGAKQDAVTGRALAVADINANARVTAAEGRARSAVDRRVNSDIRLGKSFMDAQLKTGSIPGHFANVYSSEDDAKLRRFMDVKMGEKVRADVDPEKAASEAIGEVRTLFAGQKREAMKHADVLSKAKVNPKDVAAVTKAAQSGNAAAVAFLRALGAVRRELGEDAATYLFDQVPGSRK